MRHYTILAAAHLTYSKQDNYFRGGDRVSFLMFNFPTGYFMPDLDFAIMPCAPLERAGYEFTLSASFSRTQTPAGVVVPFVRDAQTGFHFLIDHLLASPGLRAKHNIAEYFKLSGDPGEVNDLPPQIDAESCPAEPDSAATLTASLQSDLGGTVTSLTWSVEKPEGVQVRPQTRSQVPKSKVKGGGDFNSEGRTEPFFNPLNVVDSRSVLYSTKSDRVGNLSESGFTS